MRLDSLDYLCCPNCKSEFRLTIHEQAKKEVTRGFLKCYACEDRYEIKDGLANLICPATLEGQVLSVQRFYDQRMSYDYRPTAFRLGIWSIAFRRPSSSRKWADRLELSKGASVLEVGVGNGRILPFIGNVIGNSGRLDGLDISSGCLRVAREKMRDSHIRTELIQGNASYLPYNSKKFDGVLSVGGFNDFAEKKKAIQEMHRVAKVGAKVVITDEGLAPDRKNTLLGKYILKSMNAFANKPPLQLLPDEIEDLKIYWIYQRTFWIIEYRKSTPD